MYKDIRKKRLLTGLNMKKNKGLEIGALCWPLVSKKDTKHIQYVDHATNANLREIYKDEKGVDLDAIVKVHFPLEGRSLKETVGETKKFDYIIASHVIEHVPDVVRWLQDMSSVMTAEGTLRLAIPDRRYTFDIDRSVSSLGDILGSYIENRTTFYPSAVFNHLSNYRSGIDASYIWRHDEFLPTDKNTPHRYSINEAYEMSVRSAKGIYTDAHVSVFTPSSFIGILRGLISLSLTDFSVLHYFETAEDQYEFIIILKKGPLNVSRQLSSLPVVNDQKSPRELEVLINGLASQIRDLDETLAGMRKSNSWRVTRPLRGVVGIISILKQTLRKFYAK